MVLSGRPAISVIRGGGGVAVGVERSLELGHVEGTAGQLTSNYKRPCSATTARQPLGD